MSRSFKQRIVTALISSIVKSASGGTMTFGTMEELLSAASATSTQTTNSLLPANSLILAVTGRVTTTLSGGSVSGWKLGDTACPGRFTANDTTLTANETKVGIVHWGADLTGSTQGPNQASASTVLATFAGGGPTAGAIRITSYYITFAAATS